MRSLTGCVTEVEAGDRGRLADLAADWSWPISDPTPSRESVCHDGPAKKEWNRETT